MTRHAFISLLLSSSVLLSCTTTPTQDSDFTIYGEEMEGPGVFTGDSGKAVFFEDNQQSTTTSEAGNGGTTASPGMSETLPW